MVPKLLQEPEDVTTIEVKFTCDDCRKQRLVEVRVSTHFHLGNDNIPEGWVVRPEHGILKCYCPEHAKNR